MIKLVRKSLLVWSTVLLTMQTLGMPIGMAKANELSSIPSNPIELTSTESSEIFDEKSEESEEEGNSTPEQQKEDTRDSSEGKILESEIQGDTIGPSEDSLSNIIQTWNAFELRDFPLTISHMNDVLRPELIPDEVKYIATNNSQMPATWPFFLVNGAPINGGIMSAGTRYTIADIVSPGSNRLIDISVTPRLGSNFIINSRGAASSTRSNDRMTGQVQAVYTDDQTLVEGYMLLTLHQHGGTKGTQSISKEDLKGIVVTGHSPDVLIREYEDRYTFEVSGLGSIGIIVPTTYTLDRTVPYQSSTYFFWPRLMGMETSPWNPEFKPIEVTGLVEEEKFVSKYEITQDVPLLSGGDYKLTLSTEAPMAPNPSLMVYDENEEELDIGSLQTNDQEQTEVTITASEIAQFRGKKMKIGIEYRLISANQSNLAEYLTDEGYVSIPLSARSNKGTDQVSATAQTWVRPSGEGIHQEIGLNTSTSELNPADFVGNLENKLLGDEPFAVDFAEDREFDTLGETSIGVVIESAISGIQNTVTVPLKVIESTSSVFVHHINSEGDTLAESEEIIGKIGDIYETSEKKIENYRLTEQPENKTGIFEYEPIEVIYIYETTPVIPVDPLDPGTEVNPGNPPVLPEDQGLFSLDFASHFDFGSQTISAQNQIYYAKPQRLLNEDGTVKEDEVRPNYVQVSDRRSAKERDGWELSVRQNEQFHTDTGQELTGARLILQNQQIATAQGGIEPGLQHTNPMTLIPGGAKRTLLKAQGPEGEGTWIYRFGNAETAAQSVALEVPNGATPTVDHYKTTLTWELSSVPKN